MSRRLEKIHNLISSETVAQPENLLYYIHRF